MIWHKPFPTVALHSNLDYRRRLYVSNCVYANTPQPYEDAVTTWEVVMSTPTRAWYEAKESSARHIIASKTTKNETATGFQNRTSGASPDGQRATTTTVDQLPNEQGIICPVADKDRKEIGIHIPEVPARGVARFRRAPCAPTPTSGIVGTQATWHVMNANVILVRRVSSSQTGMWSKSSKSDSIRGKRCLRAASTASLFWASGILTQIAGIRAAFSRQKSSMVALSFSMVR